MKLEEKKPQPMPTSMHMDPALKHAIGKRALDTGQRKQDIIEAALRAYLKEPPPPEPRDTREMRERIEDLRALYELRTDSRWGWVFRIVDDGLRTLRRELRRNSEG